MEKLYYRTTYYLDFLHNLEFINQHLEYFSHKAYQHKWLVIGMHNLLQSVFVIMAKERGSNFNISRKKDVSEWFKRYDNDEILISMSLANFDELGKKALKTIFQNGTKEYKDSLETIEFFKNRRNSKMHNNIDSMSYYTEDNFLFSEKALDLISLLIEKNQYRIHDVRDETTVEDYNKILKKVKKRMKLIYKDFKSKL